MLISKINEIYAELYKLLVCFLEKKHDSKTNFMTRIKVMVTTTTTTIIIILTTTTIIIIIIIVLKA